MPKPKITLYVDVVSPFGWLAFYLLRHSPVFKACEVTYVPMFLGGVMKATGNTPPLYIKNKDKWINQERIRWATQFQIPIRETAPPGFPIPTINAGRALCAIELKSPSHLIPAIETLSAALWSPDSLAHPPSPKGTEYDVKDPEVLTALLAPEEVLGGALAKDIVSAIGSPEVKAQLTKNTEEAIKNGAFGLPWFHCTNAQGQTEGFWGFDHIGQVVQFLGLEGIEKLRPML